MVLRMTEMRAVNLQFLENTLSSIDAEAFLLMLKDSKLPPEKS